MKKSFAAIAALGLLLAAVVTATPAAAAQTTTYTPQTLSTSGSGWVVDSGHFDDVWDLTHGDMQISFTYDANGLVDDYGGAAHAWAELGVRSVGPPVIDWSPYWQPTTVTAQLLTGKQDSVQTGSVDVSLAGTTLTVTIKTAEGYTLNTAHVAVADDYLGIPHTGSGKNFNPNPGKFEINEVQPAGTTEATYTFDITGMSSPIAVAVHVMVNSVTTNPDGTTTTTTATAWADGKAFPGTKTWATYIEFATKPITGVWLATDYDWAANTFDPDPVGAPSLDLDDKLILQRQGGQGEGAYNLPSVPPAPGNNHRVWWDRDGVDPWQNPATANTGGIYQIIIKLHATSDTTGTAYMNIRELDQGFETDGNWNTIELTPAGMTFVGDMQHLQVFYALGGYGATHTVTFKDIAVSQ